MSEEIWRSVRHETEPRKAVMNMGIDESILEAVSSGKSPPTMRFYTWKPSAISVGYFQGLEREVDVEECRRRGVDVIRRITGGGAVYHDTAGELTYSVVAPEKGSVIPRDIRDSYRIICDGIMDGLRHHGIESSFRPLNDIVVDDMKISGNAQTRRKGCVLQHGTILLDVDVDHMFSMLRVPAEKMRGKLIETVKSSVTSVRHRLGEIPDLVALTNSIESGIAASVGVDLENRPLTGPEMERAGEISRERYGSWEWTSKR